MYATIAALVAARVAAKAKALKEKRNPPGGEREVLGMRLEKEKQIMRLARRSLRR